MTQHTNNRRTAYLVIAALAAALFCGCKGKKTYDVSYDDAAFDLGKCAIAADNGYAPAQYNLGKYLQERYRKHDELLLAVEYFTKAAESGNVKAQTELGWCYQYGSGGDEYGALQPDYEKSAEWYTKAAESGDAEAQYGIGWCYCKGIGVEQDMDKAEEWMTKSKEQGYAPAEQWFLGDWQH